MVKHAAAHAAPDATGALSTISSVTVNGGYTAAGIGMRNLGYGSISITGVPAGATVQSATLLWDILADNADPTFAQGTFDGTAITGTEWASGATPCWPVASNFSYETDVSSLVTGNGSYNLAGFASGESDGADPWNVGSTPPLMEGASLVVVYTLASMPQTTIQIGEGATETDSGIPATATLGGFTASGSSSATTTYIVADGQYGDSGATFNGSTLSGVTFPGVDPQAVPNYSLGNLWDTTTADVSSLVSPGDTSATLSVTGNADCLVWVGQVLSASNTKPSELGFGDSVSAGYGLGPAEGSGDNPSAYPAVLGQLLGNIPVLNESVEGVCASSTEPVCSNQPHSVDWQIIQVPGSSTPSQITVTVGANDIDFADCLKAVLTKADFSMTSSGDPCNPTSLTQDLTAFKQSLTTDLQTLSSKYPGVPIQVMDYYNPFPQPPTPTGSPCLLDKIEAIPYEHTDLHESWATIFRNYILHRSKYVKDARTVQMMMYNGAQTVLGKLNAAVNAAAGGIAKVVDTSDFTGHGICGSGSQWVFYPTVAARFSVTIPLLHKTVNLSFGGQICPDPVPANEWNAKETVNTQYVKGTLATGVNCFPHPTTEGQQAIANDFYQQN